MIEGSHHIEPVCSYNELRDLTYLSFHIVSLRHPESTVL